MVSLGAKTEYLTKGRAKQGKRTFREGLGADLAAERLGVSVILLAGICSGYLRGWIHFDSTCPGWSSPAIEVATTFGKAVVLYMEMQRSDVMADR
jgi:hypothetical protein